jgi:hypothetical protein
MHKKSNNSPQKLSKVNIGYFCTFLPICHIGLLFFTRLQGKKYYNPQFKKKRDDRAFFK